MPISPIHYVAPSTSRTVHAVSFNAGWFFHRGEARGAEQSNYDDSGWRQLRLPHDWAIEGPFDKAHNARCGGLPFHGTGWYRKRFSLSKQDRGKRFNIEFDGAMYDAHVWINGTFLGKRPNGYIGFEFDLTDHLCFGSETNVIVLRLEPQDLSSRWYPGAGIYRKVWFKAQDALRIPRWGTYVTTPVVTDERADIRVKTRVINDSDTEHTATLVTSILDDEGRQVAHNQLPLVVAGRDGCLVEPRLVIEHPRRWDIDAPYRYTVETRIEREGVILDTYLSPFGVRTIDYSPQGGFKLNGKRVQIQGVCLHHDLGPLGTAVNVRAIERQLEIMREMGANAIRTSHNPPAPELLAACDRMGFLVQVEAFDCWRIAKVPNDYHQFFDQWHERDLRDMIRRDRNHPCVIMWSIGNEILEQQERDGWRLARRLHNICRDEDPTRPTTAGFNLFEGAMRNGLAAEVDLPGFNYKPLEYEGVLEQHPDWIIYGSETSSCTSSRGVYHLPIEKYDKHPSLQVTGYDLIGPPWAYPPDIEFHYLEHNPRVLGEFIWTGIDYLGEPTPFGGQDNSTDGYWNDDWPARSSYFGPVDLCGLPKDRFYLYQSQWSRVPMVHVLPHWNWQGREGAIIPVYVYTNCDEAELFVNGVSQGIKRRFADPVPLKVDFHRWPGGDFESKYRMCLKVPYAPGSLRVVGYVKGRPVCEKTVATAGAPARIRLIPDRDTIAADGEDLSFVTARIEDADGHLCPLADDLVCFDLNGPGEIVAVGSGNAATTEPFRASERRAFNGRCMLILRSKVGQAGHVQITASARELDSAAMRLAISKP